MDVYSEEAALKENLGGIEFQTGGNDHTFTGLTTAGGEFPPMNSITGQQPRISYLCPLYFLDLQLCISLSVVVTLFARSILKPLKRLCCLVSPFKSPNPA